MIKAVLLALTLGAHGYVVERTPDGELMVVGRVEVDVNLDQGQRLLVFDEDPANGEELLDDDGLPRFRIQGNRMEAVRIQPGARDRAYFLKRAYQAAKTDTEKAAIADTLMKDAVLETPADR